MLPPEMQKDIEEAIRGAEIIDVKVKPIKEEKKKEKDSPGEIS